MKQMITLRIPLIVLTCLVLAFAGFAAAEQPGPDTEEESLPIGLTDEEKTRLDEIGINHQLTAPPTGSEIFNPAEWEPSEGVIIRWPLGISVAIVAEMSEDLMITCIVEDSWDQNQATNSFTSGGVNMANVQWLMASTNTYWTRDYGPWFIFEDQQLAIVDHIYNRPRPQDDVIPQVLGSDWGLNVYGMDLITTGGNHMSNGLGTSMSTELVWDENPSKTPAEIDSIMQEYLGNQYEVLEYIESFGIHHIDCWAKFLNPTTILVKDVPSGSSSKPLLDARADYLSQQISPWGQPYTVVRVYCPYGTAYTNSIILNDKVLVPIFSSSWDDDALQTYQDAMPGYEILGFTGSWLDDDAIHCRTMGVPDRDMLRLNHVPLAGEAGTTTEDYYIGCNIAAFSGQPLIDDSLKVFYSVDGGAWESVALAAVAADSFETYIPAQATDAVMRYYIQGADQSGRVETHPYIGAPWAHEFTVTGPHAPSAPTVMTPVDTGGWPVYDMLPTLTWTEAVDPDPNDTVMYTVELSDDELFTSPVVFDSLTDTSCPVVDSLEFSAEYWWRVEAFDRDGLSSMSAPGYFRTWVLGDVDHSDDVTLGDLTVMIDHLFLTLEPIEPAKVGDLNADCQISLGDLTIMIDHLFIGLDPLTVPGCE
ncbi:hypothetical protein GF377_10990 [candidate division GN15 bacterium]|nr:hypothetical protein [candidate division GN15 bacterium]